MRCMYCDRDAVRIINDSYRVCGPCGDAWEAGFRNCAGLNEKSDGRK